MNEDLTPKELARIKRAARKQRIRTIRRRVTTLGATLAAVFTGIVLVRAGLDQTPAGSAAQPSQSRLVSDSSSVSSSSTQAPLVTSQS